MKRYSSMIIRIILILCMSLCIFAQSNTSYAVWGPETTTTAVPQESEPGSVKELTPENFEKPGKNNDGSDNGYGIDESFIEKYGEPMYHIFFSFSVIISVIAVMAVGLKYIMAGVTQKADYKKDLIPMLIGFVVIVFLNVILATIAKVGESI